MSIEARYLGARSGDNWRTNNYNELNIIENGFLDEFKLAMANLQANNAAGGTRAGSFAYFGAGTGTAPLPIILAYFNGVNRSGAGDACGLYVRELPSATYVDPLARFNPHPYVVRRRSLEGRRRPRATARSPAGLPPNFLLANPDLTGGANIVENTESTMYNSMALEFRRRSVEWAVVCRQLRVRPRHGVEVPVAAHRRTRWCATAAQKATSRTR